MKITRKSFNQHNRQATSPVGSCGLMADGYSDIQSDRLGDFPSGLATIAVGRIAGLEGELITEDRMK
ncbi:MAG: hypothetical protein Q7Q71_11025 [Verrucomicrobiota bacterium JB023]|nr:hypothetical protein [Verrucomicrobiota bacterium JB023]